MAARFKFLCGSPKHLCSGSTTQLARARDVSKAHGSRSEARSCYVRSKLKEGYLKTDDRRLLESPDGTMLIITKESHFGQPAQYCKDKSRYYPRDHGGATASS